ncbi:xanthine dehydrogenase family protein molybdopterin-binding subunit [Acidisphaera sp. L21]|uniref:xanthine dehydrogenase family protein molybdopterin-binding subunit n=1 Tax=Acidisphaera sp. L21 TaxID=1641851 RepID=UPI00131E2DC9|nr:xanthine dehydrogenase family protein molybdopterin-binding subunit [Acidisphaera sp. L21]
MDMPIDANTRFAIGQPVSRKEDPVLLRGEGRYSDDLSLPGQAYAVVVRSRYAHGELRGIDAAEALAMPGVLAVITAADLDAAGIGPMQAVVGKHRDGTATPKPHQTALARDRVRYVGDPVALVVAETRELAKDAAEAVMLDIDPLPSVTEAREAADPGAPQLHAEAPGNLVLDFHYGDTEAVNAAFAKAAHVTKLDLRNSRVVVAPMEPRSALATIEDGRLVLRVGCQGVFGLRGTLSSVMNVPKEEIRVLTGNVGGSFGMKAGVYPEYIVLLQAARMLGRPVKWTDARSDSFMSDSHGRDHDFLGELALDSDGTFLAVRLTGFGNLGAYLSNATTIPSTMNTVKNVIGVYRTPLVEVASINVFTNTTPVGAYRGAGRPEGNYYMERLVDTAAKEMGIDRVELRRRNHIQPDQMPYRSPSEMVYDSGDFPALLEDALGAADWDGFASRKAESRRRGKLRGIGIGHYLEVTAPAGKEMGGIIFDEDGGVTIVTGTLDYGQGHASPFAQVLSDRLGVPFDKVRLVQGDSDRLLAGGGTGGSRSMMQSGAAIVEASALVVDKGRALAADALEAAEADIEFSTGRFNVVGTDRAIGIMDLAGRFPGQLNVEHVTEGVPSAFPNGCHVCEVEVDEETGVVAVVRYTMANDFGVLVNPMLVEGQTHGGVVQGIGQALLERTSYDSDGQLLSGSFMDYTLPQAIHAPGFVFVSHPVPARTNALGAKGCGEAGCAGSLPAVMNALADALGKHISMPATPERVWEVMKAA